ncbi:hypothetical protein ACFPOG_12830 [Paenibacillus aestuarii]|uniref:Uncharacterized protein n=1 Tax=Paenibacillus aestuarii TaxID=516965 RepID=A0ABW0K7C0_9BACL
MNHFAIKAIEKERHFVRKLKEGTFYLTGSGSKNFIKSVTDKAIYVRSKKSKSPFRISREKLREAIQFMFYKRTATRKELEVFAAYNSALMGLLRLVFSDIARISKTARGMLRLSLKGLRYFFSGLERSVADLEVATEHGAQFLLLSYFSLRDDKNHNWKYHIRRLGYAGRVLLDSGAFSVRSAELEGREVQPISLEEYAAFILRHRDVLFGWMNLDVIDDPQATRENFKALQVRGLTPIPVWSCCDDGWEELEYIVHEIDPPVVAIGATVFMSEEKRKMMFDKLFDLYPSVPFHWLGGSSQLLYQYPFFSSDSTSWINGRRYCTLITPQGHLDAPPEWVEEECLAFNAKHLSSLEDNYDEDYQVNLMDLLVPPELMYKQIPLF